jgi:hypothetical protein
MDTKAARNANDKPHRTIFISSPSLIATDYWGF